MVFSAFSFTEVNPRFCTERLNYLGLGSEEVFRILPVLVPHSHRDLVRIRFLYAVCGSGFKLIIDAIFFSALAVPKSLIWCLLTPARNSFAELCGLQVRFPVFIEILVYNSNELRLLGF